MLQNSSKKNGRQGKKGIGCLGISLIILAIPVLLIGGFIFFSTSQLRRSDEDILKTYQPKPEIAEIAEKNTLTDKGKATLYRGDPELVEAEAFIKYCRTQARGVEPLACNAPKPGGGPFGGRQIFLLQIDDQRFSDHKFSATVHEMLHSAYNRLGSEEKKSLNLLLEQELTKYQNDSHLMMVIDTMKKNNKNDEEDIQEELHSKFGVEYSDLSPELEDYYKQYFTDRSKVVELFKNGGFNSRVRRMDEIRYQTKTLAPQITTYEQAGDVDNFNRLVGQYNALAAESQRIYTEIQEFYQYFDPEYKPPAEKAQ